MRTIGYFLVTAGLLACVMSGSASAQGNGSSSNSPSGPGVQPPQTVPQADGGSTKSLSGQLDQSGGVIKPPAGVDPGLTKPVPATPSGSTPVIPPPGTPGGNPQVKPK